ncbi:hypothetical protein AB0H43_02715 [Hamadaea sp. NPDC050747]|uniref:hypothetical protein n=1 Tax=Hamadaea sp. NPDC050747 TaxID=3155789 RepID=UPI0033D366FD
MSAGGTEMTAEPGPEGETADAETPAGGRAGLSRTAQIAVALTAFGLTAWFFFAWLVLDRMMLDAAGEAIGSGLLLLLLVSIVSALARSRAD